MSKLPFTHLRVELRGLTVAGRVWNRGDLIPLDGSTPEPVKPLVLEQVAARKHPHLTAGVLEKVEVENPDTGEMVAQDEFKPIRKAVKLPAEALAESKADAGGE